MDTHVSLRYAAAARALPAAVTKVMVADGSDIFFQRDPFDLVRRYATADLLFFGDRGDDAAEGARYFRFRLNECGPAELKDPVGGPRRF